MERKLVKIMTGILVILLIILGMLLLFNNNSETENELKDAQETEKAKVSDNINVQEDNLYKDYLTEKIDLSDGLVITKIYNAEGVFVEDGSDESVDMFAEIVVQNKTKKMLQLAKIYLITEEDEYEFQITTLPAGETVSVQEITCKAIDSNSKIVSARTEHVVFFEEEPSMYSDVFEIKAEETQITLKNISNETIEGPVYVYYKTIGEMGYEGGITYRVSFSELNSGDSKSVYAGHYHTDKSKVMFLDYVP